MKQGSLKIDALLSEYMFLQEGDVFAGAGGGVGERWQQCEQRRVFQQHGRVPQPDERCAAAAASGRCRLCKVNRRPVAELVIAIKYCVM